MSDFSREIAEKIYLRVIENKYKIFDDVCIKVAKEGLKDIQKQNMDESVVKDIVTEFRSEKGISLDE